MVCDHRHGQEDYHDPEGHRGPEDHQDCHLDAVRRLRHQGGRNRDALRHQDGSAEPLGAGQEAAGLACQTRSEAGQEAAELACQTRSEARLLDRGDEVNRLNCPCRRHPYR